MGMGTSFLLFWTIVQASLYIFSALSSDAIVIRKVTTAKQFQHALDKANPGDVIQLHSNGIFFLKEVSFRLPKVEGLDTPLQLQCNYCNGGITVTM